ncbi:helix-turn-helix domain-containing protein [Streptomyces aculeolatus]|uniref:helix-turn-helix domain-containing protein n=1 Tax=Streptomyces aculeolatus TaxID=270689 RepID=UPI001CED8FAA|nr:helix-turn-helix transcriptional regulator [Streptomyces aculeolatus]
MPDRDLERLAKAVKARRLERYPSRREAAIAAGVSKDTFQRIEEGQPVRDVSYVKVDRALGWAPGSCDEIAQGGEPVPVQMSEDGDVMYATVPITGLTEKIERAVTDATMAVTPDLTVREIKALNSRVIEELQRQGVLPETDQ